jgi:two-component system LytT family response regulator
MNPSPKLWNRALENNHMHSVIRTIIADDEPLARNKLRILLDAESGIEVVAECRNAAETIAAVRSHKPDLLFLDIQMPDADGFEVLNTISAGEMPATVFTTAYDQFAIRAFEAHALDYLLKPFDQERLHHSIERAQAEYLKSHDSELAQRLLDALSKDRGSRDHHRLVIKAGGRVVFVDADEIHWVEAAANYVKLKTEKESYLLRESIGHVSERLDAAQFIRIHRSTIVNVKQIKELQPCNSGEYIVVLKSGKELSCSRGYRAGLQQLIENRF